MFKVKSELLKFGPIKTSYSPELIKIKNIKLKNKIKKGFVCF